LDVSAVPERLQERVREPQVQDVLDGFLAEVVIDPKNPTLVELAQQRAIELPRALQIATEGLLHDDARPAREPRAVDGFDDSGERARRDREIVRRPRRAAELRPHALERLWIVVVA